MVVYGFFFNISIWTIIRAINTHVPKVCHFPFITMRFIQNKKYWKQMLWWNFDVSFLRNWHWYLQILFYFHEKIEKKVLHTHLYKLAFQKQHWPKFVFTKVRKRRSKCRRSLKIRWKLYSLKIKDVAWRIKLFLCRWNSINRLLFLKSVITS